MRARVMLILMVFPCISLIPTSSPLADWVDEGIPICQAARVQSEQQSLTVGSGGTVLVWTDDRNSSGPISDNRDIYIQYIDSDGNPVWPADGIAVCTAPGDQWKPRIVKDGSGGAIIVWEDYRSGAPEIYAQRINAAGAVQWTMDGVPVRTGSGIYQDPDIIDLPGGEAYIAWDDTEDIYGQRLNSSGVSQYPPSGAVICNEDGRQSTVSLVPGQNNSVIVVWWDDRPGYPSNSKIYAQRVLVEFGTVYWIPSSGVLVCDTGYNIYDIDVISDGEYGLLVAWSDIRGGMHASQADIYVQRVLANGSIPWITNGVKVCGASEEQYDPCCALTGPGELMIGWSDTRNGNIDIYLQHIDASGDTLLAADGIPVCVTDRDQQYMDLASDGEGGIITAWADKQIDWTTDLLGQRVDSGGRLRWPHQGIIIAEEANYQTRPEIIPGEEGRVLVTWQDNRSGDYDLYALELRTDGRRSNHPAPYITLVEDVPADQGERVSVFWGPSPLEDSSPGTITDYSVYRDDNGSWDFIIGTPASGQPVYSLEIEATCYHTPSDTCWQKFMVTAETSDPMTYYESLPDSGYAIDNIAPAILTGLTGSYHYQYKMDLHWNPNSEADLSHYCIHRASVSDFIPDESNLMGTTCDTTYQDTGITGGDYFYKVYAVDLAGNHGDPDTWEITLSTQLESFSSSAGPGWIEISWVLSEKDQSTRFEVRRSAANENTFHAIDGTVMETGNMSYSFRDNQCEGGKNFRYRVFVSDNDGTRLLFETNPVIAHPLSAMLLQNIPNPFNPNTDIRYYLPERTLVQLSIYDLSGRLIATLEKGIRDKGYHTGRWNGRDANGNIVSSGVYFYRLRAGKKSFSRKMVLLR